MPVKSLVTTVCMDCDGLWEVEIHHACLGTAKVIINPAT